MNSSDKEKAKSGAEAMRIFFEQFGPPDNHTKVVFETLFEVMNEKKLPVFGEERQEGDNPSSGARTQGESEVESEISERPSTSDSVDETA